MLHNQELKSKGEKQQWWDANVIQTKRKAQPLAFLLSLQRFAVSSQLSCE